LLDRSLGETVAVRDVMPVVTGDQTDLDILPKPKVETCSGRAPAPS
jgi:hypothetical protein